MKIITKGRTQRERMNYRKGACACGCLIEIEPNDALLFVADQRDGDFWQIKCPTAGCRRDITIADRSTIDGRD